ncbi:hypothetical protein ElyMa_005808100 [Elysia marginata]|uniref:Uncharacterized protein n=1 Tax=Elysia marginata TaxID=1093978 RepID=A0AAV4FTV4_9GAST|nr:hypothetical protein ElyMa_005808100 [Elysia marginata]
MENFFTKNLDLCPPSSEGKSVNHDNDSLNDQRFRKGDKNTAHEDDDDDDFDIRDYHNPIAGANFKLRLHPFGNLVEFDNKGESKKFNLLTRRNVFVKNSELFSERGHGDTQVGQNLLVSSTSSERGNLTRIKSEPPFHNSKSSTSPSPFTQKQPFHFSKYPEPLPPISPTNSKKLKAKKISAKHAEKVEHDGSQEKDKDQSLGTDVLSRMQQGPGKDSGTSREQSSQNTNGVDSDQTKPDSVLDESVPKLTRRKTLILPPLETSKEMVMKKE